MPPCRRADGMGGVAAPAYARGKPNAFFGSASYLPNHHPRWLLHRAELLTCEENLITAAGLPALGDAPVSVLYSAGVPVLLGRPSRPAGIPTP